MYIHGEQDSLSIGSISVITCDRFIIYITVINQPNTAKIPAIAIYSRFNVLSIFVVEFTDIFIILSMLLIGRILFTQYFYE